MKYTLEMCIPNIKSWWNGAAIYTFDNIDAVISFIKNNIPNQDRNIKFILERDSKQARGSLAGTSWYSLRKGARLMTDYTSY